MNLTHHHHHQSRRKHRKRTSLTRLSSDTVQTLPEYTSSSPPNWNKSAISEGNESDRPPDYSDSEEADTEEQTPACVPQHHQFNSPRRTPSYKRRRKRQSVSALEADPFLDMLLERSVHALEMSNALLQSSMSTQSSLSALLSPDGQERSLEIRASNLSTRIRLNSGVHGTWMDHLEEISNGLDGLLDEDVRARGTAKADGATFSQSLPTSNIRDLRHRRKPSLLELNGSSSNPSPLQFSYPKRDVLVAPAPRALTQYVESTADPCTITLPSTLGLRAPAPSYPTGWQDQGLTLPQELQLSHPWPVPSVQPHEFSTPAYNLLSNIAKRSESATPPPAATFPRAFISRRGSASTCSTERRSKSSMSPCSRLRKEPSPDRHHASESASRSRSTTPKPHASPPLRVMTPPIEELSATSSDSSDHPTGYRTVQSLRKILDEQTSSVPVSSIPRNKQLRFPNFMPVTPAPTPVSGTSTATASISRLLTKGRHSSSTRPPSPPTHSSLRVRSVPPTPSPSPSAGSLSDILGIGVAKVLGSNPPSGVSTPKRISFAELPESYASSRPGTSKFQKNRKSRSRKRKGKDEQEDEGHGWFQTLFGVGSVSTGSARGEEERMARGWGSRPGGGTLDDWAV